MKKKASLAAGVVLIAAALVFALLSAAPARAAIWSGGATQPPGVGTPQSPYQISTGEHLKWFANQINNGNTAGYANLIANIVLDDTSNQHGQRRLYQLYELLSGPVRMYRH